MLQKKIDRSEQFLTRHQQLFQCPRCQSPIAKVGAHQLTCLQGHQFDLAKKGTLNFLTHQIKTEYDRVMLGHRQKMIQSGLYQPLLATLARLLVKEEISTLVDMGCGEGSFLKGLADLGVGGSKIGFDISKDGINLASEQELDAFWCVADLTNLPFADGSLSHILTIFSPSQYEESRRVLKPGGKIIKVVPEADYLKELRQVFYADNLDRQAYSNEKVVRKFQEELTLLSQERVTYQFPVSAEHYQDLLKMSPLHWGASSASLESAEKNQINLITIDALVLVGAG